MFLPDMVMISSDVQSFLSFARGLLS